MAEDLVPDGGNLDMPVHIPGEGLPRLHQVEAEAVEVEDSLLALLRQGLKPQLGQLASLGHL
eukprot:14917460-Heterocapsa_arctica.AAC.1